MPCSEGLAHLQTLEAIAAQVAGVAPSAIRVALRPALTYQSNRLYDVWTAGAHWILKEYVRPEEMQEAPAHEFQALKRLASLDIAPQPVFYDPSVGPYVIYEFMEGEMWDRRHPGSADLERLARVWIRLGKVPTEGLWLSRGYHHHFQTLAPMRARLQAYAEWVEGAFPPGRATAELCLRLLESRIPVMEELATCPPHLLFCRCDERFANVIERPDGRLGLVDWEDSGLLDAGLDLADLVTHANQEDLLSEVEWQAFMAPYLEVRRRSDPELPRRMHLYRALLPLFWLSVLAGVGVQKAKTGQLAGWTVNTLPANERLRRYLARGLAWPELEFDRQLEQVSGVRFFPTD